MSQDQDAAASRGSTAQSRVQAEATLIARAVAERDHSAFAELLQPYRDAAYNLARSILQDSGTAEDALQEAYFRAWKSLPRIEPGQLIGGWILRTVTNVSLRLLRTRKARDTAESGRARTRQDQAERSPEDCLSTKESIDLLKDALGRLDPEDQRILALFYAGEMSQREIGRALGVPQQIVSYKMRKSLARIHAHLKGALSGAAPLSLPAADLLQAAICSGPSLTPEQTERLLASLRQSAGKSIPDAPVPAPGQLAVPLFALAGLALAGAGVWFNVFSGSAEGQPIATTLPSSAGSASTKPVPIHMAWDFSRQDLSGIEVEWGELKLELENGRRLVQTQAAVWLLPAIPADRDYSIRATYRNIDPGKPSLFGTNFTDGMVRMKMRSFLNRQMPEKSPTRSLNTEWFFIGPYMLLACDGQTYQFSEIKRPRGMTRVVQNGTRIALERLELESLSQQVVREMQVKIQGLLKEHSIPGPWWP